MTDYLLPPALTDLAKRVVEENIAIGRIVALAESCTGGLCSAAITEIAGSSAMFDRGFVTYSNGAKLESLGVSEELVDTFGAVSPAVAWGMARGAIDHSDADIAVAITGVAGPGGGSDNKPVGTVVFACARRGDEEEDIVAEQREFGTDKSRAEIRLLAAQTALELLLP